MPLHIDNFCTLFKQKDIFLTVSRYKDYPLTFNDLVCKSLETDKVAAHLI